MLPTERLPPLALRARQYAGGSGTPPPSHHGRGSATHDPTPRTILRPLQMAAVAPAPAPIVANHSTAGSPLRPPSPAAHSTASAPGSALRPISPARAGTPPANCPRQTGDTPPPNEYRQSVRSPHRAPAVPRQW